MKIDRTRIIFKSAENLCCFLAKKGNQRPAIFPLVDPDEGMDRVQILFHRVFRNDQRMGGQDGTPAKGPYDLPPESFAVGRVQKDKVKGFFPALQKPDGGQSLIGNNFRPVFELAAGEVLLDYEPGGAMGLHKYGKPGPPAYGLNPQRSRSGKEIQNSLSGEAILQDIENGFFDAIGGGPQGKAFQCQKLPPLTNPADHSQ
jgi:hypothetical protein